MATMSQPTYSIEADVDIIHKVSPLRLSIRDVQLSVDNGTLGWYYIGGRLIGPFSPGEQINYQMLRTRWGPLVGMGQRKQRAILVSMEPQRVQVTIYCPLLGMSPDPAAFITVIYFEVADFEKLASRSPGLIEIEGREALNQRVITRIREIIEESVKPLASSIFSRPELLTPTGAEKFKELILANINLSAWGLTITGDPPPVAHMNYPQTFVQTVYEFRLGYQVWQFELQKGDELSRRELIRELTRADAVAAQKVQELLMRGIPPSLDWLVTDGSNLLDAVFSHSNIQLQEHAKVLRTALISRANGGFLNKLVAALDRDFGQVVSMNGLVSQILEGEKDISAPDWRSYLQGPARSMDAWTGLSGLASPWQQLVPLSPSQGIETGTTHGGAARQPPTTDATSGGTAGRDPGIGATASKDAEPVAQPKASDLVQDSLLQQIRAEEEQSLQAIRAVSPGLGIETSWSKADDGTWRLELQVGDVELYLTLDSDFQHNGPMVRRAWVAGAPLPPDSVLPKWQPGDHLTKLVEMIRDGYFTP